MSDINKKLKSPININQSSLGSLIQSDSEEDYLKNIEESNESFRRLQEKTQRNKSSSNNSSNEEEEDEDEDEEDDEDELSLDNLDEEEKNGLLDSAKKLLKKVGAKSLIATGGAFGTIGVVSTLFISMYRVHYNGEFEFKGIGGEYQNSSFKNMNFTSFDNKGDVQLGGLTKENKLTKAYYTLYSDNSYYAIVEDSNKYSDVNDAYKRKNILTPEELRKQYPDIKDVEGREKMFQLNPDVLYSLDRYLHKNQFLYPQQFVKPVYYEESKNDFKLKSLVENGSVVAKSQVFNSNGSPSKNDNGSLKKKAGIWDYGLASVLCYKEYDVKERTVSSVSGVTMKYNGLTSDSPTDESETDKDLPKVGESVTQTINKKEPGVQHPSYFVGTSGETVRDTPAYAIEKAVTAGGTITSKVSQKWQEKEGSRRTETFTDTIQDFETIYVKSEQDLDSDGEPDLIPTTRTHNYEVTYTYEYYTEEYVPFYEGDLDTSEIIGSKYYREYIRNYSNYIPKNVPKEINFSVLDNEEVSGIFVDDDPIYGSNSTTQSSSIGNVTEEEFSKAVFMGDSITVGLSSSGAVPSERVFAQKNLTVSQGSKKFLDDIIAKKPPVVVIGYGTNDAGYNNSEQFGNDFKTLITKLKTGIPNVKIYVSKIFPGNSSKAKTSSEKTTLKNIPTYNSELSKVASESGVKLIDCTGIANLQDYYSDAFHFKNDFNKIWLDEIKKQIVSGASSSSSSSGPSSSSSSGPSSSPSAGPSSSPSAGSSSSPSAGPSSSLNYGPAQLPSPREGENRALTDVIKIGSNRDSSKAQAGLKWLPLAIKYGEMYGVDPYIICAIISAESNGVENAHSTSYGLMGLMSSNNGTVFSAYNHKTKTVDKMTHDTGKAFNGEYNIQMGTMMLADCFKINKYNVLMGIQGHNFGPYGVQQAVLYYLSGGTRTKKSFNLSKEERNNLYAYSASNHVGWVTALYDGDLAEEREQQNGHGYLDPNDGKHDAVTWYGSVGPGQPYYLRESMSYYSGDGMPWIMDEDGNIITVDGSPASGYAGGSASAISAFNSYMASNWQTILDNKETLYPWSIELDKLLEKDKKANYNDSNIGELAQRDTSLFTSRLTSIDEDIVLGMMFALNQGNYLSKYDYMGEAEWKAMYNQLLSSPTGKTWDDKWIGFNCEEVFGKSIEDLGHLFDEGSGINPTISRKFGKLKNMYTDDDTNILPQYNETNFGLDLTVPTDTEVLALEDGKIIAVSKDNSILGRYGNFVQIKFNNNSKMVIANLKKIDKKIKVGKPVSKGDVIGITGGNCKSYKEGDLHIELLYNDEFINPEWIITRDMKGFEDPISGNTSGTTCSPQTSTSNNGGSVAWVDTAKAQVGKPYVRGGTGPDSFDCSGLVVWSMKQHGIEITARTADAQRRATSVVKFEELQVGDLIFSHESTNIESRVYHVMIYIGDGKMVHSPKPGDVVKIVDVRHGPTETYGRYAGASSNSTPTGSLDSGCQTANQTILSGGMPIPLMLQIDEKWATLPYGAGNPRGNNIKNNGCAPTSLSMVISYLTQTTVTPPDVTTWAGLTHYSPGAGTSHSIYGAVAKKWGIKLRQVNNKDSKGILAELNAGNPVIASMGPGDFTRGGHVIVLRGVTSDGKILVNDPASKKRSEQSWDLSLIVRQSTAMRAYSK